MVLRSVIDSFQLVLALLDGVLRCPLERVQDFDFGILIHPYLVLAGLIGLALLLLGVLQFWRHHYGALPSTFKPAYPFVCRGDYVLKVRTRLPVPVVCIRGLLALFLGDNGLRLGPQSHVQLGL